jgi:hypothetical protein
LTTNSRSAGRRRPLLLMIVLAAFATWIVWQFNPADWNLPLCGFHVMTGLYCPGCGATRATHELLHGRVLAALHQNALWVTLLPLAGYMGASELRYALAGRPLWGDLSHRRWLLVALAAAAMLFFVIRNLPVYPCTLLAPP